MVHVTGNQPNGTPNWLDLGIPDLDRAKEFYGAVFGWEFQDYGEEAGHYHACLLQGEPIAGMMRNPDDAPSECWWQIYFATDDVDGTLKRATDAGGTLVLPADDVMDQGRMAMLKDPTGAQFGLWQGRAHIGTRIKGEPGAMAWSELSTTDSKAALDFYGAVFGYVQERMPGDLDYTALKLTAQADDPGVGGVMSEPGSNLNAWLTYFLVESADDAVGRVREGGGSVVAEPEDSPYGRLAVVDDPFGARFKLMSQ
ncbi:VOC family protein [Actinomadura barringtoniae]|uniref:VOC family protein n=1 Tax=Actinomadura barringtoniae TaxID=1427535 RepID=A0A939PH28_9ACTN|nr:VOC family protein [Actinomadura barringtoniae]MBO2449973.1 VOC family protein [Actinomadura barringtoniae]